MYEMLYGLEGLCRDVADRQRNRGKWRFISDGCSVVLWGRRDGFDGSGASNDGERQRRGILSLGDPTTSWSGHPVTGGIEMVGKAVRFGGGVGRINHVGVSMA
jgi:hypothetical protein